ncbi:hypothetical protein HHL24_17715 [Paraburkholderia sp. RP-4-7]|uniref:Uncharacterized protein n=1 Tax=Paraburkholderia polaris TaxID=2728848 RepID=A0A848IIS1_9BURK|nr:hypothetical protein [Paraburkholderia polaris]NML99764.1 hypothetical protein [Paraburkholderia polaris]
MNKRYPVSLVIAASLAVSFAFAPEIAAQAGTPGTKQMQDAQRNAEQKARSTSKKPHKKVVPPKAGSAMSASAP